MLSEMIDFTILQNCSSSAGKGYLWSCSIWWLEHPSLGNRQQTEENVSERLKKVCVEKSIIISFKIYPHKYFNNTEIQKLKAQVEKVFTAKAHSVKYLIHSLSHSMEIIITIKLIWNLPNEPDFRAVCSFAAFFFPECLINCVYLIKLGQFRVWMLFQ